ncbi:BgTH12-05965 [Blumeria graminis f. sp. triticale]|uniref:BgtA-20167 n=3 Tax=Blumeria graminis TaxID=34373 RepID=A0A9X9MKH1_BLUGR|nr:hypothetical protein BGT96224_A20167 [Blumeria graminis f. sp. tritici 96224]CAD6504232.1 BgTH12-05965 [Blumeria graminis f. sp. triticale]VDB91047.1 BgtA-20167 [Blumeria graminis f. sp. tritici]
MPPAPSKAGIIASNNGERHIPSSTRADGTKRKEIKIRPGYEPPEDVEVYKNRSAEIWRDRGSSKIPGAEGLKEDHAEGSAISNKNAKRREARKKAREVAEKEKDVVNESKESKTEASELSIDVNVEKEKKAKNLRKKIKQAKELRERKDGGTSLLPEQLAKVIKINELVRELQALGLNNDEENNFTIKENKD